MNFSLFVTAYSIIFATEMLGDKTLCSVCVLATRYRAAPVFLGLLVAFMIKMGVAVGFGDLIAHLPAPLVAGISAATFFLMALVLWLRREKEEEEVREAPRHWGTAALAAFSAIFFTEWGDAGQIAAATLAARYHAPLTVWCGATLAMTTKGALALTLGLTLGRRLPRRGLRYAAIAMCLLLGCLAAFRID